LFLIFERRDGNVLIPPCGTLSASNRRTRGLARFLSIPNDRIDTIFCYSVVCRLAASYRWRHSWQHAIESHAATDGGFWSGGRRSRVLPHPPFGTPDIRPAVRCGRKRRRKIVVATRAAERPFQRAQTIGRRGAGPVFCSYPP